MGRYVTSVLDENDYNKLISTIRTGYTDKDGHIHRPNEQIAVILVLEANLGCRIGDIMALKADSIVYEGGVWKLNIIEQKTKKKRSFIVPQSVKSFIDDYMKRNNILFGKLFDIKAPAVWRCLRQVTEYLGLENVSSHSMRKFAAQSLYEKSGYDISLVSQWLQHGSVKTTQVYLRRSSKQMESAIEKMVNLA